MSDRTFKVAEPFMEGGDIKEWQKTIRTQFEKDFGIDCPIKADGIYGHATRSFSAALVHSEGLSVGVRMKDGVTPELRQMIRNDTLPAQAKKARASKARKDYRAKLKKQWTPAKVHQPVTKILADSWGYHPGVHDGVDVICLPAAPIFAMVKAKVIDVRSGGWWGKAPSGDVSKGDGIIQLEVLETVGPFKKGHHIGYGHAEGARVRVGQIVQAGDHLGHAGLAVAWHVHLMYNDGSPGTRGVGNIDPRKILDYTKKHG